MAKQLLCGDVIRVPGSEKHREPIFFECGLEEGHKTAHQAKTTLYSRIHGCSILLTTEWQLIPEAKEKYFSISIPG